MKEKESEGGGEEKTEEGKEKAIGKEEDEDRLKEVILPLFREHGVCSLGFLTQKVREWEDSTGSLRTSDKLIRQTVQKHCFFVQNAYVLRSIGDPQADKYRQVLIEIFLQRLGTSRKAVEDALQAQLNEKAPERVDQALQEFAYHKNSVWIFKAGN